MHEPVTRAHPKVKTSNTQNFQFRGFKDAEPTSLILWEDWEHPFFALTAELHPDHPAVHMLGGLFEQ